MQFQIFCRDDDNSCRIATKLENALLARNHSLNEKHPDIVVFVGGDGTFLRAVNHYINQIDHISFVGIHAGTLGFFCDYEEEDIDLLIKNIEDKNIIAHAYHLLEAQVNYGKEVKSFYGVNEIRLEDPFHTLIADVHIDGKLLERFRGNGLIVTSSLGSSGYNRSLGGALVSTEMEMVQLTEIATIQNNAFRSLGSSLILPKNTEISFSGNFPDAIVGIDHMSATLMSPVEKLIVKLSSRKVNIYHQNNHSYFEVLRKTFIKD